MCVVSNITDYGRSIPPQKWTYPGINEFEKLIEQGKKFDEANGEPDCVDPEKAKLMKELEEIKIRLEELENKKETNDRWHINGASGLVNYGEYQIDGPDWQFVICSNGPLADLIVEFLNDMGH